MKHYGDITKIKGDSVPPVDIITGGSPCQDLSVAGKRAGLDGERSGLFMEQIRIIKEMRENDRAAGRTDKLIRPRYMVWENVQGAFSSNKGEDFRIVLEETAKVADEGASIPRLKEKQKWTPSGCILGDGWSIAWRVHDAQFWGVPQRRKRIALVADFGGMSAPEILFERESLSRNTEQSGKEGKDLATDTEGSIGEASKCLKEQPILLESNQNHVTVQTNGVSTALSASMGMGGGYVPMITDATTHGGKPAVCYGICSYASNAMKSNNPNSGVYQADTSRTLDNNGGNPSCNQGGIAVMQGFDGFNLEQTGDKTQTLTAQRTDTKNIPIVAFSQDAYDKFTENEKSASLKVSGGKYGGEASR